MPLRMMRSTDLHSAMTSPGPFRAHAAARLHPEPRWRRPAAAPAPGWHPEDGPSDFDLNPEYATLALSAAPPRPAAVLVPVVMREPLTVLLTLRTPHLTAHAGQVAFPGGKVEEHDSSAIETALREAEEEVGLDRRLVSPIGFLDTYRTGTGYAITPLVALVDRGYHPRPDPNEVADVFEVPLAFLMEPANARLETRFWRGRDRRFYALSFDGFDIWGATAGMLHNMRERLFST